MRQLDVVDLAVVSLVADGSRSLTSLGVARALGLPDDAQAMRRFRRQTIHPLVHDGFLLQEPRDRGSCFYRVTEAGRKAAAPPHAEGRADG